MFYYSCCLNICYKHRSIKNKNKKIKNPNSNLGHAVYYLLRFQNVERLSNTSMRRSRKALVCRVYRLCCRSMGTDTLSLLHVGTLVTDRDVSNVMISGPQYLTTCQRADHILEYLGWSLLDRCGCQGSTCNHGSFLSGNRRHCLHNNSAKGVGGFAIASISWKRGESPAQFHVLAEKYSIK